MVVVEGATLATLVTGTITMIIIGVLLNIVGLGVFCWALFALAIHALPFFVGMTAGIYTYQSRSRSDRCHRRWLRYGRFRTRGRAVRFLRRPFSRCPPCHWAAIRGSCGTRRLRCDPRPCSCWRSLGMVAGSVRHFRRHRRRVHRLGARVDPDEPALRRECCPGLQPSHRLGR